MYFNFCGGRGGSMSKVVGLPKISYKPITNTAWVRARLCKLQKGCTRLAFACDQVYQLLVHDQCFSPGTPVSSTTKTGRHDIAEILLKMALNTKNQSISGYCCFNVVTSLSTVDTFCVKDLIDVLISSSSSSDFVTFFSILFNLVSILDMSWRRLLSPE